MRAPYYPKDGYIFRHKENRDAFSRELYLGDGVTIDEYEEVAESEYEMYIAEQEQLEENLITQGGQIWLQRL